MHKSRHQCTELHCKIPHPPLELFCSIFKYTLLFYKNQEMPAEAQMFLILIHILSNSTPIRTPSTFLKCLSTSKLTFGRYLCSNFKFRVDFGKMLRHIWASMYLQNSSYKKESTLKKLTTKILKDEKKIRRRNLNQYSLQRIARQLTSFGPENCTFSFFESRERSGKWELCIFYRQLDF